MEQQTLNINQQLTNLMSTGKWRSCQRKQYNIYAILPPAGYVFANRLEQPKEFKYIQQRFGRYIVHQSELTPQDTSVLGNNCYVTDGQRLVLCGTQGELWTVKPDKFLSSYVKPDGSRPEKVPVHWTMFSRMPETAPSAKGLQIPVNYLGIYDAGWGVLRMNDPESSGHYKGDILVVSNDGQSVSAINNAVFANTFNQSIGGWVQSGCITPAEKIKPITLDFVTKTYVFGEAVDKRNAFELLVDIGHHKKGDRVWIMHVSETGEPVDCFTYSEAENCDFNTDQVALANGYNASNYFTADVDTLESKQIAYVKKTMGHFIKFHRDYIPV